MVPNGVDVRNEWLTVAMAGWMINMNELMIANGASQAMENALSRRRTDV